MIDPSRLNAGSQEGPYGSDSYFVSLEESDLCVIDDETARVLELIHNNADSCNRKYSLMGYLNSNTATTAGMKLISQGLMRPLYHLETIEHRLDCIEYLVERVDTLGLIANTIKRFGQSIDLNNVVPALSSLFKSNATSLSVAERKLDALTTIESLIVESRALADALSNLDDRTLKLCKVALDDPAFVEILTDIHYFIEPDIKTSRGKRSKMFRIKQGVESLFDIARSTYNAAVTDIEQYVRELARDEGLNWKLSYGESRGYFLTLSPDQLKGVPLDSKYLKVNRTRMSITCTTKELMQCNVRSSISYENSMKLANEVLTHALSAVMRNLGALQKLIDIIGVLDLVTSFAKLVYNSNGLLVRPKFTSTETVLIKARHPVLESVLSVNDLHVIPNDVVFSCIGKNFMLVTGPNMGGKSVLLKQIALIQIMAQMGCFVPAESAHIKLMKRIVARTGTSDDVNSSCSSFMWEMKALARAIKEDSMEDNTLFVIDEVGRGTSIDDGAGYSFALAEELASQVNSFTVFATHFEQIFALTKLYNNINGYHFKYEEKTDIDGGSSSLKITHILSPGLAKYDHYGIRLAEACGLPSSVIDLAKKDLELIT